jgi:hypothetical protein
LWRPFLAWLKLLYLKKEAINSSETPVNFCQTIRRYNAGRQYPVQFCYSLFTKYRVVVGELEGKGPLGRLRCRQKYNIKMDSRNMGMVWTGFIWLRIKTSSGLS